MVISVPSISDLRLAQGHSEFADVERLRFPEPVGVQRFDDQGRFIGTDDGIVKACCLGHIARNQHMDAADGVDDHAER